MMATRIEDASSMPMASRFRRRRMCILLADAPAPACLRDVSGAGAFLETNARPPLGRRVTLHHPEAGTIAGEVAGVCADGIRLSFDRSAAAVAFALSAVTADMSSPAR